MFIQKNIFKLVFSLGLVLIVFAIVSDDKSMISEEDMKKTISRKIIERDIKFSGYYTYKEYSRVLRIHSRFHYSRPFPRYLETYEHAIMEGRDPYIDYFLKFDSKEECENSILMKLNESFTSCVKYKV